MSTLVLFTGAVFCMLVFRKGRGERKRAISEKFEAARCEFFDANSKD